MKILLISIILLGGLAADADEATIRLTPVETLSRLNKTGVIDMVFWLKPDLMHPRNKTDLDPRIDPTWMVTIANHTEDSVVINKHWFLSGDWLDMNDVKSGEAVPMFSSFPTKDIDPLEIDPKSSVELKLSLSQFVCLSATFHDDRVEYSMPGDYRVTHDLFPSAELRFSLTSEGVITIQMPAIYPKQKDKHNKSRLDNPLPRPKSEIEPR
ncbi:hypothetical protein ACFQY0_20895 [Haloferula chungangensis]|uniref:Uncharacterized protein n=1 Tax=Haloferula chungangensis TaxID=1048331 RepID=A0ABW2LDH3_9BACT